LSSRRCFRSISKLVEEGKLELIKSFRYHSVSHTFYADDLMTFCKVKMAGLTALTELFQRYALNSGEVIKTLNQLFFLVLYLMLD